MLVLGVLLLTLVGCWWFFGRSSPDADDGYTVIAVEHGRAAEIITATGVIQPRDVYAVGAELSGKVVEVCHNFNQEVAEGELLARLDDGPVRERLKQAELGAPGSPGGPSPGRGRRDGAATAPRREQERSPEVRMQINLDVLQHQLQSAGGRGTSESQGPGGRPGGAPCGGGPSQNRNPRPRPCSERHRTS